ncbi:MAG: hypothetical protein QXM38_04250 [Candidatus Aenigmatarchaeota archaeon]
MSSEYLSNLLQKLEQVARTHGVQLKRVGELASRDLGNLFDLLFIYYNDSNEIGIREIIMAAIVLGHYGLLERGYEVLNALRMVNKAPRSILDSFMKGEIDEFYKEQEYEPLKPRNDELSLALALAIGLRGYSIDDPNTSVGELYQRLYGRDFNQMWFYINGLKISYGKVPQKMKPYVNEYILRQKGYIPLSDTDREKLLERLKEME